MTIANFILNKFDYNSSFAPTNLMKLMTASNYTARAVFVRKKDGNGNKDNSELRETLTRDIPGFFAMYYVQGIVEKVVAYGLDKVSKYKEANLSILKSEKEQIKFIDAINPFSPTKIRSFSDISALEDSINPDYIKVMKRNKTFVFFLSLAASIASLGFLIPLFNVKKTREAHLNKKPGDDNNKQPSNDFKVPAGSNVAFGKSGQFAFTKKINYTV